MARAGRTQNVLDFYTALGVNILLILKVTEDLCPREVVKGLPGIDKSLYLSLEVVVRQLVFNTSFTNYELKINKPGWKKKR